MIDSFATWPKREGSNLQQQLTKYYFLAWTYSMIGIAALIGLSFIRNGPDPVMIGWVLLVAGIGAIIYKPRYGIYLILFWSLVGDSSLLYWYPFNKNLSSAESIFYLNNSLIFSPLELYLLLTSLSWLARSFVLRQWDLYKGALFYPAILFAIFLMFGFVYGVARGGDLTIALWEVRPIFYLPLMLILVSNLIEQRQHVCRMMWLIMLAIFIESLVGSYHFFFTLAADLSTIEGLAEHSAAVHMNTLFVYTLAAWLYGASRTKRIVLPLMIPTVAIAFLASQRRAAYLTLGISILLIFIALYRERKMAFWLITPPSLVAALGYLAVFWNSRGALGLPARAVKSVVAPDLQGADAASNLYRIIENLNISYTIHKVPFTGVGFGQKILILVRLPDISFFSWWEYIVHNSVFWIWLKTGVMGFMSMIILVGLSIMTGVRVIWRMRDRDLSAAALTATIYIVMHFMYAYVDMSWDIQSMIYVGSMMGLINCLERIASRPIKVPRRRWPWQPITKYRPALAPI